jgi:diguanylate cyclase (GGDEF)-like protein
VAIFDAKAGENEIVIQVSNFYHRSGGILESIIIGSEKHILDLRSKNIAYELFLFGGLLIIGLYHLALFSFRKRDYSALYFGLFCLLIASRTILVGERFFIHLYPGFNWEVAHKVQTLAFYLGVPVIVMFFKSVFPQDISSRILRIIQVVGFSFAGLVLLTPARIFSVVNPAYQLFALLVIIYLVYAMTGVLRRKEPGATLVVVGALVLFAASINDIVFLSVWMSDHGSLWLRSIIRSDSLSSFGQLVFVFTQSLVLAQKSAFAFDKQEEMTRKLTEINIDLDKIVSKRTVALEKSKQEVERQKAKLEKVNQVLKILTLKDPLTDLWNRRHFDQTLEMEWKRCLRNQRPLAVLLIDVDFFKGYNDAYGHQAGDQCLIKVAHAIDGMFNRASDLVARYGGDEFVVIIPEAGEEEAVKMALSLCQAIEGLKIPSDDLTGEHAYVTVSIGVSSRIPDRGSSPMDLFQLADRALYQAKHAGRNQVKFLAE